MWEDSLHVCPYLNRICTGTQVLKIHPQRTYLWAVTDQIKQQSQSWKCTTGFWEMKQQKGIYELSYPLFAAWQSSLLLWNLCGFSNIVVLKMFAIQHTPKLDRYTLCCYTNEIKKPQGPAEQDDARFSWKYWRKVGCLATVIVNQATVRCLFWLRNICSVLSDIWWPPLQILVCTCAVRTHPSVAWELQLWNKFKFLCQITQKRYEPRSLTYPRHLPHC